MVQHRVTMSDIARKLHVSVGLVSQVLSGKAKEHRISDQLAETVQETALSMGYQVNQMARGLRTGRSGMVGLIVADIANPYFGHMARVVENEAFDLGYQVMVGSSDENPVKLRQLIQVFLSRQVDALVIVPVKHCATELQMLNRQDIPVVLIDRYCDRIAETAFCGDNEEGGYLLTSHLIEQGYRKPVAFTFDQDLSNNIDRIKGFRKALQEIPDLFTEQPEVRLIGEADIKRKLPDEIDNIRQSGYDSIFFANHAIALEALRIFKMNGTSIPDQFGLVSFDNPESFELHQPGITCYQQPLKRICTQAVETLNAKLSGEDVGMAKKHLMKGQLIIRESAKKDSPFPNPYSQFPNHHSPKKTKT